MDTTQYSKKKRWYKTRRPKVPLEVLACFALEGELPISKVESFLKNHHDHHVISDAFKYLKSNGMIYCTNISTPDSRGGRPKSFFKITERGLELLISESPSPSYFWNVMLGYCYHNVQSFDMERMNHFFRFFIDKYLKYPYDQWYTFDLDLFDRASRDWLDRINSYDKIPLDQVILETLAIYPDLTIKELKQRVKAEDDEIREALFNLTPVKYQPVVVDFNFNMEPTKDFREKWQILFNMIIKVKVNPFGNITYRLSLYGLLFVLTLVRNHDMGRSRNGLYYDKSFLEYCDVIAGKYRDTMPLIFKKWHLLKKILGSVAAYNFDIILDSHFRETTMRELSAFKRFPEDHLNVTSGNKYLYEGSKSIIEISRRQLSEVQMRGREALSNFVLRRRNDFPNDTVETARKLVQDRVNAVSKLILEITVNLETVGYDPTLFKQIEWGIPREESERLSQFFEIDSIERPITNEITFLYYLNLNDEWYFHIRDPSVLEQSENIIRPLQCLLAILKEDSEIREWFSSWVNNLVNFHEEELQTECEFYNKIRTPSRQV